MTAPIVDRAAWDLAQRLFGEARLLRGIGHDGPADTVQRAASWFWVVGLKGQEAALAAVAKVQPSADYPVTQWGRA